MTTVSGGLTRLRVPHLPVLAMTLAVTDIALGGVYLFEPSRRAQSPGLDAARHITHGHFWIWGLVLLVIGCLAVTAVVVGFHPSYSMSAAAGWHMFFTLSLIVSVAHQPTAGLGGCVIFTSFVLLHMLAARQR